MPEEPQAILQSMTIKELRALASENDINVSGCRRKQDYVDLLASHEGIYEILGLEAPPPPPDIEDVLMEMRINDLRSLAKKYDIDIKNLRKKADIVLRIAKHPNITAILKEESLIKEEEALEQIKEELEETRVELEEAMEEIISLPPVEDSFADPIIQSGKNIDVDFSRIEDLLDDTRMRFEERNYDQAIKLAGQALDMAPKAMEDFQKSAYAYGILAMESLIVDCGRKGADVEHAVNLLRRAKTAYGEWDFERMPDLFKELREATEQLYSAELEKAKELIFEKQDLLIEAENMGADVSRAKDILQRAQEALRRNDPDEAMALADEAGEVAVEARMTRITEIEQEIPATWSIIEEARNLGSDISEAEKLMEQAEIAMRNKNYVLVSELIKRAEHSAMESQHYQIEKAMELRRRQVEKAQAIINEVEPIIVMARDLGIDVSETISMLDKAKAVLQEGDYVNGTLYAKEAQELARKLEPEIERARLAVAVEKPTGGICGQCNSRNLRFYDNGWGKCLDCGRKFQWMEGRRERSLWDRVKRLIWE